MKTRQAGQRYESAIGLYYYGARWYDPMVGRFIQPDTIVPGAGNSQAYDRYEYTNNNPLKYTDPTGHRNCEEDGYNCPGDKITTNPLTVAPSIIPVPIVTPQPIPANSHTATAIPVKTTVSTTDVSYPDPIQTPPLSTPAPPYAQNQISQSKVINNIDDSWSALDVINGGWNFMKQHYDAIVPVPILGFARGAYKQSMIDIESGYYSGPEIIIRSSVSGLEGAFTDVVSTGGGLMVGSASLGACGGFALCAIGGYIIGGASTYIIVDNTFTNLNEDFIFPFIHNGFIGE